MLIDLRHLLRNFRRSPASAAAAILTLSLTLGVGASVFAVVDAVLLTPPPFPDPDRLVTLGEILPGEPASAPRSVRSDGTHLTLTELGTAERVQVFEASDLGQPVVILTRAFGLES